ncbi:MAG TPA: hypothetical protein VF230_06950 [Acidimicrobiales bacterium]
MALLTVDRSSAPRSVPSPAPVGVLQGLLMVVLFLLAVASFAAGYIGS